MSIIRPSPSGERKNDSISSGQISSPNISRNVVFPLPLGPTKPILSHCRTSNSGTSKTNSARDTGSCLTIRSPRIFRTVFLFALTGLKASDVSAIPLNRCLFKEDYPRELASSQVRLYPNRNPSKGRYSLLLMRRFWIFLPVVRQVPGAVKR